MAPPPHGPATATSCLPLEGQMLNAKAAPGWLAAGHLPLGGNQWGDQGEGRARWHLPCLVIATGHSEVQSICTLGFCYIGGYSRLDYLLKSEKAKCF